MYQPRPATRVRRAPHHRFTLVELLIVVTLLLILAALLLPVLNRAVQHSRRVVCISNVRQLVTAWFNFQGDHGGKLPIADEACYGNYWGVPNDPDSWMGCGDSLAAIREGSLYPYAGDWRIYRCPGDPWKHVRTYSPNGFLNGPLWEAYSDGYQRCTRFSKLTRPDSTFAFIEEYDNRGNNYGNFVVCSPSQPDRWVDTPGTWHFAGANLSFADGHVECWTWTDPRTMLLDGGHYTWNPGSRDLKRLAKAVGLP